VETSFSISAKTMIWDTEILKYENEDKEFIVNWLKYLGYVDSFAVQGNLEIVC